MGLKESERERLQDGLAQIHMAQKALKGVKGKTLPGKEEVEECLESADRSLREALGYARPK